MQRMTVSVSDELVQALDALAKRRNESRSSLVELLLREHPLLARQVQVGRQSMPLRPGRSLEKVLAIADQGRRNRDAAIDAGVLRFD